MMDIKGKKVVVVGLGRTGCDVAEFLLNKGADVFITEERKDEEIYEKAEYFKSKGAKVETGKHTEEFLEGSNLIVVSPGVHPSSLPVRWGKERGIPVISEIELAYIFSPSGKIIGITGTNGKTTTSSLTFSLFKNAFEDAVLCGNIGNTYIGELGRIKPETWVVIEISSFQLEFIKSFSPFIGIILNITPDHLDRHNSMENYAFIKAKIFENSEKDSWAILNRDDFWCRKIGEMVRCKKIFFSISGKSDVYLKDNKIISENEFYKGEVISVDDTELFGYGNIENMMASICAGLICGIDIGIIRDTLKNFKPLPHRLEKVCEIKGITFINDSKATNIYSVKRALESFPEGKKIILIMGGRNKGMDFSELSELIGRKVKFLILLGESKRELKKAFSKCGVEIEFAENMEEAVRKGYEKGREGDTVLLSPGCSSFDMFKNYQERGDVFKEAVKNLL